MVKAIIFDMDGVLVNTEPLHYRMWKQVFENHGVMVAYDVYKRCIGSTAEYLMQLIYDNYGVDFRGNELIREEAARVKRELIRQEGYPLIEGVVPMLRGLYEKGYLLAVASSSPEIYIEDVMERLGVRSFFTALCSGESVAHPKPAPDVFLKAARQLGVRPDECVVFEDSNNGCQAAVSAEMICVGYDNPDSGEQDLSMANAVIKTWEDVTEDFFSSIEASISMYTENDLVRIARRENNLKRNYLVVNRLQGKHIPVSPSEALNLFKTLGVTLKQEYQDERLLLVGFAETATAIGAAIAIMLDCYYIQTTREDLGEAKYLYFSEAHSHATEQKLVRSELDGIIPEVDRIIFIEDEVTTGNTIMNIIKILKKCYPGTTAFSVASVLNGMDEEAQCRYRDNGVRMHYLVKTDHSGYGELADAYQDADDDTRVMAEDDSMFTSQCSISGSCDARRLIHARELDAACWDLWREIKKEYAITAGQRILVLGTEEFMYPPLFVALQMERCGGNVKFHATTRSPIEIYADHQYPLKERYELCSLYDQERKTYIYNLAVYDQVFIITDATTASLAGERSLLGALKNRNNQNINLIRWVEIV